MLIGRVKSLGVILGVVIVLIVGTRELPGQQITHDTLSYYILDENSVYWVDDCGYEGYCKPVAVQFEGEQVPSNTVDVESIRFKIAVPGTYQAALYAGGFRPAIENVVWVDSISVGLDEVDNSDTNEVSPWKEINFTEHFETHQIDFPIWFQIDAKTYDLGFSLKPHDLENPPNSFYQQPLADSTVWVGTWGVEFISELIVSYPTMNLHEPPQIHSGFQLCYPYPNPFNPSTTIRYGLPEESNVSLIIYDVRGQVVQTLESEHQSAGWYDVTWNGETADGKQISTGIYFARLVAGEYSHVVKMLYLK